MHVTYCINNNLGSIKTLKSTFYRKHEFNPVILLKKEPLHRTLEYYMNYVYIGKVYPWTGRTAQRRSRDIALLFHDHSTRRGWGVSVTPRPLFTPRKDPVSYRRLGGPQSRSGQVRKTSPPPGFDSRTAQPVASSYTNYATRPKKYVYILGIYFTFTIKINTFLVKSLFHIAYIQRNQLNA
jgi:hypothetical protein